MNPQQVEDRIIELMYREPFVAFIIDLSDGESLEILRPNLAIAGGGAGFIGPDGGLVDFEFENVLAIRVPNATEVA